MTVELLNIDCMEYMAGLPDKAFDLAIVDPPYGIGVGTMNLGKGGGIAKHNNHKKAAWDKTPPSKDYFHELFRVSEKQIIWGGNYFDLPPSVGWIVWKKMDIKNDFNPLELAWTSGLKMGFFDYLWAGMWQGDMKNKEARIHPTQKPVKLYEWILANYAKPGHRILDTHLGSGSSAIAAHYFGCDFVGCEIDPDYYQSAKERFDRETAQQDFFGGAA